MRQLAADTLMLEDSSERRPGNSPPADGLVMVDGEMGVGRGRGHGSTYATVQELEI